MEKCDPHCNILSKTISKYIDKYSTLLMLVFPCTVFPIVCESCAVLASSVVPIFNDFLAEIGVDSFPFEPVQGYPVLLGTQAMVN